MTSFQSTLGEGKGIAEELAESQREISIAEFFERNKQMLGFDSAARALVTAVKEGVDNSLTRSTPFVYRLDDETHHGPIGDVIDDLIEKNREEVITERDGRLEKLRVDGMEALSFDDEYDVDFQRVSSVFRHRVNSDVYRITVEGGREVELTDYHSIFVLQDGEVVSVETSNIERGDYVVLPNTKWDGNDLDRIDLVAELSGLPAPRTEAVGLYGVEQIIDEYYDTIREQVDEQYRVSDFRKCDRLPFNIVRRLDLDVSEYSKCEIGYRYGPNNIPAVLPVDEKLAELLGLYVAEGCVTGGDHEKVYLSLGAHEEQLIDYAERLVEQVFGLTPSTVPAHDTATNVTIPSKIAGLVFEALFEAGTNAADKRIPRFLFDFPERLRERFLIAYGAGDGYPTSSMIRALLNDTRLQEVSHGRITFSTTSDRLASGLRYIASSIGYDTTHEQQPSETRVVNGQPTEFSGGHLIHLRTDQSGISLERVPADEVVENVDAPKLAYNLDGRQTRVETDHALALADGGALQFREGGRDFLEGDLGVLPVTKIETIDYDGEWVYDVSVPGDENFMAGTAPLACHNSLDACEEADIPPDIYVDISESGDYYTLVVEDNGPGITKEQIPNIFGKMLYGSRFHRREQSLTPDQRVLVRRDGAVEFIPIGVLCDAYLPQDGEGTAPVSDDIEVPSFDRDTHEMTWQPVTHAIRHETDERTYEITTERGRTVEVTGNHSVFSVTKDGETTEVKAGELEAGDALLAPRRLPSTDETVEEINLLEYIDSSQLDGRRVYVYGFDEETLAEIRTGETVRRKPSKDSPRERYYYRYDGVEIRRDSLEQNYIEKGYLPAETVLELGWEAKAADCEFRTYQVGGEETTMPVTLPVDERLLELVAHYVSEGHTDARQVGFTFGSHESALIEATENAVEHVGGSVTTVQREGNSTRVKAFGSPLAMFLESACGAAATDKRIPGFVFDIEPELQRRFIAALYAGDGSDTHPSNELSHTTTSETLARQLSVLWNMQGVVATTGKSESTDGYGDDPSPRYRTKVFGADVDRLDEFETKTDPSPQRYNRVPTSLLDDVRVGEAPLKTVPDTVSGLLLGAGVGSNLDHADVYRSLIEDARSGEYVEKPRYVHNLKEMGLLDEDHRPTNRLDELWETVQNLQGLTNSDMCLLPVKTVEETDPPEYVYDISVPGATGEDENFVVANEGALSVKNSRGQQGLGISAAVLYAQLTSGKPARITSRPKGAAEASYFELIIDTEENEPEIAVEEATAWDRTHGTRIELEMEANLRARKQLLRYVQHTAVVNPHARITVDEPKLAEPLRFERADDYEMPAETEEIRPHPHGVELGTLRSMLEETTSRTVSGFLQEEFTRVGKKTADEVVDAFRDRHFGREMAYSPPAAHEAPLEGAVEAAVANKAADATAAFAERVAGRLADASAIAHQDVVAAVEAAAEAVEEEFGTTFGDTVRENAVEAAWGAVTGDGAGGSEREGDEAGDESRDGDRDAGRRSADTYRVVDGATSDRKDDATVRGLAERIATKFAADADRRDRATREEVRSYVESAADRLVEYEDATVGETAREKVAAALWERMRTVPEEVPRVRELEGDRDATDELHKAMQAVDVMAPPTECLAPITAELVEAGLRKEFDADFYAAATRDAEVHKGDPFIVEAGIAYGGELEEDGTVDVLRFANRVPLVYKRGACATTTVLEEIGWRNYGLDQPGGSGLPNGPAVVMVHVASTNVPFTSQSKDAVANVPAIEDEIELAVREAARELKAYLNERRSIEKRRRKRDRLATILPAMADKLAEVTGRGPLDIDDSLARIMGNVLIERELDDGTVELTVENNLDAGADLEVTDIVSAEPAVEEATVVEMDGEWFVTWTPTVAAGETATLEYGVDGDADFELAVEGVDDAKLTINEP